MHVRLEPGAFGALIFDCDGTLVDTAPAHFRAFNQILAPLDLSLDWDWYIARLGLAAVPLKQAFESSFGRKIAIDPAAFTELQATYFLRNLHLVRENGPIADLARRWHRQVPLAVASSGSHAEVLATLQAVNLTDLFSVIVTSGNVARLKPAPDIFLEASRQLNVPAARCIVFEDSDEGMAAAAAAQMPAIDIRCLPRH